MISGINYNEKENDIPIYSVSPTRRNNPFSSLEMMIMIVGAFTPFRSMFVHKELKEQLQWQVRNRE